MRRPGRAERHYWELDALRGIAALAVAIYHIGISAQWPALASFGYLAVDLFFMMSGFVIARSYEHRLATDLSVGRFLILRIGRLYPCLILGVMLACLARIATNAPFPQPMTVVQHAFLIPTLDRGDLFPLNVVLWSLFFELCLNCAHALALPWLTNRWVMAVAAISGACFFLAIVHFKGPGVGWGGATFFAGFARATWGYAAGVAISRVTRRRARTLPPGLAWSFAIATALLLYLPNVGHSPLRVLACLFVIFPTTVAVCALSRQTLHAHRASAWLGGISYPLYAIHLPLIGVSLHAAGAHHGAVWGCAVLCEVLIAAHLVENLYDAPLRSAIKARLRRAPPAYAPSLEPKP